MKAEIFYLEKEQSDLCDLLARLLKKHVYRDIEIVAAPIDEDYRIVPNNTDNAEMHNRASRYLQLLKDCVVKMEDFDVVVRADDDSYYYYLGGKWLRTETFLNLYRRCMTMVFPAVAVMDRMVLVPEKIADAFEEDAGSFTWLPRPLDVYGVLLTDFSDLEATENAMAQIARQLRDEIARMCARQMAVRAIMQPDFEDLGSVLHISRDFLLENRSEIVRPTALLCAKAISGPIVIGESCRVVLMIEKAAECPTEIVSVKVRAPAGTLRSPSAKILEFRRNESGVEKLELEVCARVAPYCPLEVIFTLDAQATEFAPPPIPVILNVERP